MNIVIFGAGAIGSLFGAKLSKNNNVVLIGRKPHVDEIKKSGLSINGKTKLKIKIDAKTSIDEIDFRIDLLILTVKAFDTENAIKQAKTKTDRNTIVLSLQNGLDNIEKIEKIIDKKNIIAGVTTEGAFFKKPGVVVHTGKGETILGELNGKITKRIKYIVDILNKSGFNTKTCRDITKEIWIKAIINSSINPLTAIFRCKNGYLLKNPVLEKLVENVCRESTSIANACGVKFNFKNMINRTKKVISDTSENYSSMLQSLNNGRNTEIESINGKIIVLGKKGNKSVSLNEMMLYSIKYIVE